MPADTSGLWRIRPAGVEDSPEIARVLRASMSAAMPYLPVLHTPEEDLGFVSGHLIPNMVVDVAERQESGRIIGFSAVSGEWVEQLYLLPGAQRLGIGTAFLARAMARSDRLRLWTFQRNAAARRFYEARGFVAIEETDGSRNEEREPDVLYEWRRDRGS